MQHLAWHHAQFMIPGEWEITAYSVEDRAGRLEFSTREGFQSLLSWEPCKREPDTETMMLSFLRKRVPGAEHVSGLTLQDLTVKRAGSFLLGFYDDTLPCQALCYLPSAKKLVSWVFAAWNRDDLAQRIVPILESYEPNEGPLRHYSAFGLRFDLPEAFLLEDMMANPANVMMGFESRRKVRVTFRRWGLPELVLSGDRLAAFHERILRVHGGVVRGATEMTVAGMEAAETAYEQRGEYQMDKFLGRRWENGQARIWYDREQKRIYAFEQIGPPKRELLEFSDVFPHLK